MQVSSQGEHPPKGEQATGPREKTTKLKAKNYENARAKNGNREESENNGGRKKERETADTFFWSTKKTESAQNQQDRQRAEIIQHHGTDDPLE